MVEKWSLVWEGPPQSGRAKAAEFSLNKVYDARSSISILSFRQATGLQIQNRWNKVVDP